MKKLMLFVAISATSLLLSAQDVKTIYKQSSINLVADSQFGLNNNWDKVFSSYQDTIYNAPVGKRKSLIVLPDGSSIVSHTYKNFYTKFSPTGEFVKEFGVIGKNGKRIKELEPIACVLKNETLVTMADKMGTVYCLDFDGNLKKTLKLNYSVSQIIAFGSNKIAAVGWSLYKDKFRHFVAIVDYNTNKEKIVWDYFEDDKFTYNGKLKPFVYTYQFESGCIINVASKARSSAFSDKKPRISCVNNNLVVADPATGNIFTYNNSGTLLSKSKLPWTQNQVTVDEQIALHKESISKIRDKSCSLIPGMPISAEMNRAKQIFASKMEADLKEITEPINLPFLSTIINDNKNNLLIFEYPTADNDNKFGVWVYDNGGKVVGRSSFTCNDFDLEIIPSKMVFHNGYLYSLQNIKNANGIPMRLVRFKLQ